MPAAACLIAGLVFMASVAVGEFSLFAPLDHPAIQYPYGRLSNPVAELNRSYWLVESNSRLRADEATFLLY